MGQIIKFACLIGLRPSECVEVVRLINDKEAFEQYYDPVQQALLHYKFPKQFLRTTKKAYISFVTPKMLDIVNQIHNNNDDVPSYNAIRLTCYHKRIKRDMRFARKIFAGFLRQEGIQPEVVDLLQGRVPPSVLTRHYLVPGTDFKQKVLQALEKLQDLLLFTTTASSPAN
jgi:intergrase/recombinase